MTEKTTEETMAEIHGIGDRIRAIIGKMTEDKRLMLVEVRDLTRENILLKDRLRAMEAESVRRTRMLDGLERDVMAMRGRS